MDPSLSASGKQVIQTADFNWHDGMQAGLRQAIVERVDKWVEAEAEPPYCYDISDEEDMRMWVRRRADGMRWVTSRQGFEFAKRLYCEHATIFSSTIKSRANVKTALEQYYKERRNMEQCKMRQELEQLLKCIATGDDDVVDSFSFVVRVLLKAVFLFFREQVRSSPAAPAKEPRFIDREDMAKTYYLCGCVLHSVRGVLSRGKKRKLLLPFLNGFTVDASAAAQLGLPTRHVTMRTGGGLSFASKAYYLWFSKLEDRFFCTVSGGAIGHNTLTHLSDR